MTVMAAARNRLARRGGEVEAGQPGNQPAVHLFGERHERVVRPQPGLDVPDRDAAVEGGQCGGDSRGRVPLCEDDGRFFAFEDRVELSQDAGGQLVQRLTGTLYAIANDGYHFIF